MKVFEITTEQSEYLATLFHNQSMLILGAAGTGKSVLALEAVRRQIKENTESKILYLCSNAGFKEQIKRQMKDELIVGLENVTVATFSGYFDIDLKKSLEDKRRKIICFAKELYQFSLIIIDEAQELQSELLYDLSILANHSKFYIFGDEYQRIQNRYDENQEEIWKNNLEISNPIKLKKNYRNPKNIVNLIQKLIPSDYEQFAAREDDAKIEVRYVDTPGLLKSEIVEFTAIHEKSQVITILRDTWSWTSSILKDLFQSAIASDWMTVKHSLGIESENTVVVVEDLFESKLSLFLYTAITRTLGDLKIIFYCGENRYGVKLDKNAVEKFRTSDLNQLLLEHQTEKNNDI